MPSQGIYFLWGHAPKPPSISMLRMLIVLCTITTRNQKLHFICVTMLDLEIPLKNCRAWYILDSYMSHVYLIVHPPLDPWIRPWLATCTHRLSMDLISNSEGFIETHLLNKLKKTHRISKIVVGLLQQSHVLGQSALHARTLFKTKTFYCNLKWVWFTEIER